MKQFHWHNWLKLPQSLADRARRSRCAPRRQFSSKPVVEGLEERVVPAFDLTVGAGQATSNVSSISVLGTTIFTPTASGAFLNANDILTALNSGNVKVTSGDAGTEAGNITIAAGLTGPNGLNNALTFTSGTGVNLVGNIIVNADLVAGTGGTLPLTLDATGTLTLNADLNAGPAAMALAAMNGSIVQTSGTVENTTGLSLSANSGIGASATPLQTRVSNLVAETSTGGIFINNSNNPGPLTIGFTGDPFHGVQVTGASGNIQIVNDNSITINGNGEVVKGPGNVTLKANGASSNIVTGGNNGSSGPAIQAGAALTLSAGQDILIGDAGSGTRGDVIGVTSISITASHNVIVDQGSILASGNADNPGSLTVTASGDISVLGSGGPAVIETQNGPINLTTGVGGTFTNDSANGVDSSVGGSAGGNITISADNIVFDGTVDAGAGIVTLQQATSATAVPIDLGGGTTSGAFNISNADLAEITAGIVRIGRTDNTGSIVVTAPVATQPGFNTLSLRTGGSTTETGTGAISVANLAIDSFDGVNLSTNASPVSSLAANVRSAVFIGAAFDFLDSVSVTVGTVDGIIGLSAASVLSLASSVAGTALTVSNAVMGGVITFTFDNMRFAASVAAGQLTLDGFSSGQLINLGGANAAGTLGLSAASLSNVGANVLQIGDGATGNVSISAAVGWNQNINLSQVRTLIIDSGAAIVNTGGSLTVPNLALEAVTGIGGASSPLATAVSNLAFLNSTNGAVAITNAGELNIAEVGPLSTSSNASGATNLTVVPSDQTFVSSLNFTVDTTSSGTLTAAAAGIAVSSGVSVKSTSPTLGNVDFESSGTGNFPASVSLLSGSLVQAAAIIINFGISGLGTALIQGTLETFSPRSSLPIIQGKSSDGNNLTIDYAHGAALPDGLAYDGGPGSANTLVVSDQGDGASNNTFDIDALRVIHNNEQPIGYFHVSTVTVYGGNLSNTFTVTPTVSFGTGKPTVTFFIVGGASGHANVPPIHATNTLIYNAVGAPVGTFGVAFTGGVSELGSRPVNYEFISVINLDEVAAVNAQTGPDNDDRGTAFNGLNANERFVQALYLDALRRAGSKAELDSWAAFFNTPNSTQEQIQGLIATGINHSLEARDALVKGWYVNYLGRPAHDGDESFWVAELLQGATQEQVLSQILGSAEFFNRTQILVSSGSPQERFVQGLYLLLLYRTGAASEVQAWVNILPAFGTQGVAAAFLASTEFREYQFQGYYNTLFFRPSDTDGLQFWANSGANFDAVLISFESTSEFFTNG